MVRIKIVFLLSVVFVLASCQPFNKAVVVKKALKLESVAGNWVSVDTSSFIFASLDFKIGGSCNLFLGPGKEMATLIVTKVALNGVLFEVSMKATDDGTVAVFNGKYDEYLDTILLSNEELEKDLLFVREKVFLGKISSLLSERHRL